MTSFYLSNILGTLLLPPGTFLILLLAAWFSPWRWIKRTLLGLSFFGLYLLSTWKSRPRCRCPTCLRPTPSWYWGPDAMWTCQSMAVTPSTN